MIKHDKENRTTYFLVANGCWIGVSDRSMTQFGFEKIFRAIDNNYVKILFNGKWDYLLKHATMM